MLRIVIIAVLSFIAANLVAFAIGVHVTPLIVAMFGLAVLGGALVALVISKRGVRNSHRPTDS